APPSRAPPPSWPRPPSPGGAPGTWPRRPPIPTTPPPSSPTSRPRWSGPGPSSSAAADRGLVGGRDPGGVEAGSGRLLGEPDGVADRAAARVVVEVDVGVGVGADQAGRPAAQGARGRG